MNPPLPGILTGNRKYLLRIPWKEAITIHAIGKRIKDLRLGSGMTQEELGAVLGKSPSEIEAIESAESPNLDSIVIRALCETFGRFPREFLYDSEREFWDRAMGLDARNEGDYVSSFLRSPVASDIVSRELGEPGFAMLGMLVEINLEGIDLVRAYVEDLTKIDDYRKDSRFPARRPPLLH